METVLSRRALRHKFGQRCNRLRSVQVDCGRRRTLSRNAADNVRATILTVDNERPATIRAVYKENRYRLRWRSLFIEVTVVARHTNFQTRNGGKADESNHRLTTTLDRKCNQTRLRGCSAPQDT